MGAEPSTSAKSLPLSQELRIDAVCQAFEAAWRAAAGSDAPRPRIEDFLAGAGDAGRWPLLRELLRIELHYRRGEDLSPEEYGRRFPEHAEQLVSLFGRPNPDAARAAALPTVPGYEVLGELGRGGMGVVYKARQLLPPRTVALKMIRAGPHAGAEELARFRAEAEAVARLQHPNIVQIFAVGEHEGLPYFSMEFCGGGSLAERVAGTPQPAPESAELVETLAQAVHAAHQAGIVHRDLKPANVLLQKSLTQRRQDAKEEKETEGQGNPPGSPSSLCVLASLREVLPKITDFGLAKKLEEAGQTRSGAILGTAGYMPPEQAAGKSKDIGPAADVYALGAILYELLTGRPPFQAASDLDMVLQVVSEEPAPPRRLQPNVPRDLETVCLKCLEKDPRRRYATAADLADDLRSFRAGGPIRARPPGPAERVGRWARSRPALAATWAALALLYCYHLMLLALGDPGERGGYHWFLTGLVACWALGAAAFQTLVSRSRRPVAATFAWSAFDVLLLTVLLLRGNGPRSMLLPGYLLLMAAAALRFRVGLVWFVTGLCVLSYAGLQLDAVWRRPDLAVDQNTWNTFALTLVLLGLTQHLLLRRPSSALSGGR